MVTKIHIFFEFLINKSKKFLSVIALFFPILCSAQYFDSFDDGNFNSNPKWFFSKVEPQIIRASDGYAVMLTFNRDFTMDIYDGSFRTASTLVDNTRWGADIEFDISENSDAYVYFYIISLLPELERNINEGIYVRFDLKSRKIAFCHEKQGKTNVLAESTDRVLTLGNNRINCSVTSISGNAHISCTDLTDKEIWNCNATIANDLMSASSGVRLRSDNPDFSMVLHGANCGEKPDLSNSAAPGAIVFSEIMFDPTPVVALPDAEWVEIYNRTDSVIRLDGCTISSSTTIGTITYGEIYPQSYTVLCSAENAKSLGLITNNITITANMPALRNDGDTLRLYNAQNQLIAEMHYSPRWHEKEKREGGWSLEKQDVMSPIDDKRNWSSSQDTDGGTIGKVNSINRSLPDGSTPCIKSTGVIDSRTVRISFNKKMESDEDLTAKINVSGNNLISAYFTSYKNIEMNISLKEELSTDRTTEIGLSNFVCYEGIAMGDTTISVAKAQKCGYMDVVINELMPYVREDEDKFIELYNNSDLYFDLSDLVLCNRNDEGSFTNRRRATDISTLFAPHSYAVISSGDNIPGNSLGINKSALYIIGKLPSMASKQGRIILVGRYNNVIDEVVYSQEWHHPLLRDKHSVSLERCDPMGNSSNSENWHSASSSVGYHTAGWQNSQGRQEGKTEEYFTLTNKILSHELGFETVDIEYSLPEGGYMFTMDVFSRTGVLITRAYDNEMLSQSGTISWDGTSSSGGILPVDVYVLQIQAIHHSGEKMTKRFTIVIN